MKAGWIRTTGLLITVAANVLHPQTRSSEKSLSRILVFNDQSHEFTFQYEWWIRAYLPERYVITSNLATLDEHRLKGYQILLVEMHSSGVTFTDREIDLVEQFVRAGGGLFVIGNGSFWFKTHAAEPYPLNRLSHRLGFEFTPKQAKGEFRVSKHEITAEIAAFEREDRPGGQPESGTLKLRTKKAEALVVDEEGTPVLACRGWALAR